MSCWSGTTIRSSVYGLCASITRRLPRTGGWLCCLWNLNFSRCGIRRHMRVCGRGRESFVLAAGIFCGGERKSRGGPLRIWRAAGATALGAFSHAMLLEHLVDGNSLSDSEIRHLLGLFFDAVVAGER